jgi:hypothetical protein
MTSSLTCNAALQAIFYEVQHEALQHLQHDASCCIIGFRHSMEICSAAQHLLGAAFAALGAPLKGWPPSCCRNAALPDLHHLQHDASCC